jgi:signal transduction histidine kinase
MLKINQGFMDASDRLGKQQEALLYGMRAIENAEKVGMLATAQSIRLEVGFIYFGMGENLKALNYFYQSLNNWDGDIPQDKLPQAYIGIGKALFEQKVYSDAEKSLKEALKFNLSQNDKAEVYNALGEILLINDDYLPALENFSLALTINRNYRIQKNLGENYKNIGEVYYILGQYKKAENFYQLALEADSSIGNHQNLAQINAALMNLEVVNGDMNKALNYGKAALIQDQSKNDYKLQELVYAGFSQIFQKQGDFQKSLAFYKKFNEAREMHFETSQEDEINEFRVKYEIEKKERELEELNNEKRLSELAYQQRISDDRKEKNMLFAFGVLMFIIILLGAMSLFNYQRQIDSGKTIAFKTEEINRVKIKELEKTMRLETMNAMLQGQETERNRISKDLHDSLGALLSSVKLHFESIRSNISDEQGLRTFKKTSQLIDDACHEIRNISHDMMPGSLMRFGLVPALRDYASKLRDNKKLRVDVIDYGVPVQMENSLSLNSYRIVQELLNNIIKHADAKDVLVQLTVQNGKLNIMVEDDGIGFEPDLAKNSGGLGLKNIISRVNYLEGHIHFDSEQGKGTNIMIDFPLAS